MVSLLDDGNYEQEGTWKEAITTKYKVLSWYLPDGIE
jgi:hypothetical protein